MTEHNDGQIIYAKKIEGGVHQHYHDQRRRLLRTWLLDETDVRRLCSVYVPVSSWEKAVEELRARRTLALVGDKGSGRHITGVNLADSFGLTPLELRPATEDLELVHPMEDGHAYLLNLDGLPDAAAGRAAEIYLQSRPDNALLILLSSGLQWQALDLMDRVPSVEVHPAAPMRVLRSHLSYWITSGVAEAWIREAEIIRALDAGPPAEAARMALIISDAPPLPQGLDDVLAAYRNWAKELESWFLTHEEPANRALLLATAALEGEGVPEVFGAAGMLLELSGLPFPPGRGLADTGARAQLDQVNATVTQDGSVRFVRHAYATAVLDHAWIDHPRLRDMVSDWLVDLPGIRSGGAAYALAELAIRQNEVGLVIRAAGTWAAQGSLRGLAVEVLTEAGMSDTLGRLIRQRLYAWAKSDAEHLHRTVVSVCGGPLGAAFPLIALTRLRHVADRASQEVQLLVVEALGELAVHFGPLVLKEICDWTEDPRQRSEVGWLAFRRLNDLLMLHRPEDMELLSKLWRDTLRGSDGASAVMLGLESAAQGDVPQRTVIDAFVGACRSSFDIGLLLPTVNRWARMTDEAQIPRTEIRDALLRLMRERDPLGAGAAYDLILEVDDVPA